MPSAGMSPSILCIDLAREEEVSVSIHYSLFCMLLDLDDPSRVVRRAEEPLMTPATHPWHLPKFPLSVAGLCTLVP
jgi:hypothetical protein